MAVRLLLRRLLLLLLLPLLLLSSWLPIHCAGGASLAEAFEQVADGMFAYMTKIRTVEPAMVREVVVEGARCLP